MSLSAHMKYPKYTYFGLRSSYIVIQAFAKQSGFFKEKKEKNPIHKKKPSKFILSLT